MFGKGGKTRAIQLPASVATGLAKLRGEAGEDDPVFRSRKHGTALKTVAVLRIVRQAARGAGIELAVSPHWLRHAHASHALDRGAPILAQATLGHASITTTGRYLHARPMTACSWRCKGSRAVDRTMSFAFVRTRWRSAKSLLTGSVPRIVDPLELLAAMSHSYR